MDIYVLHLAMAALIGALFVAVSVYYMDRKTLTQLLEFAKTMNRDRNRNIRDSDFEDDSLLNKYSDKRRQGNRRDGGDGSGSGNGNGNANGSIYLDDVPPGLPKLHTVPEGNDVIVMLCL